MGAFHDYLYYLIKMYFSHSMPSQSSSVLGGWEGGGSKGGTCDYISLSKHRLVILMLLMYRLLKTLKNSLMCRKGLDTDLN